MGWGWGGGGGTVGSGGGECIMCCAGSSSSQGESDDMRILLELSMIYQSEIMKSMSRPPSILSLHCIY